MCLKNYKTGTLRQMLTFFTLTTIETRGNKNILLSNEALELWIEGRKFFPTAFSK
jgi:hypothetical protein